MGLRFASPIILMPLVAVAVLVTGCQQDSTAQQTGTVPATIPTWTPSPSPTPTPRFETTHQEETFSPCSPSFVYPDVTFHQHFVDWAKDDSYLVFDLEDTVWTVDMEATGLRQVADAYPGSRTGFPGEGRLNYGYHADGTPASSRIVYATCEYSIERNLFYEIATVNVDGTGRQRLTTTKSFENYPVWSPDGTRIAYIASFSYMYNTPGHYLPRGGDLYTMAADGSDQQRLRLEARGGASLHPPVWSPDGQRLALVFNEQYGDGHRTVLYTIGLDGSDPRRIGETTGLPGWSPDSQEIAFASDDGDETGIYMARADGGGLQQVVEGFAASQVSWSPNGSELLFISDGAYVVGLDGSDLRRVGFGNWPVRAAWSTDGSKIAVYYPGELLVTLDRDGTDLRVLVEGDGRSLHVLSQPREDTPIDLAACSRGFVVPEPEANPGLVEDCATLLGLRDTLAGSGRLAWDTDTPISEWQGVVVGGSPLRVRELVLVDTGLTGTLPPALGGLAALRTLNISTWKGDPAPNRLSGSIPPELGSLTELEGLNLYSNSLSGQIPPELANLPQLQDLWLADNSLSGRIPPELGNLPQLQILWLADNSLGGSIPLEPGGFAKLEVLIVGNNNLGGSIPIELSRLARLRVLDLSGNLFIGGIPPELGRLSNLGRLNLSGNRLGGDIPPELGSLKVLHHLDLSFTGLTGSIPPELGRLAVLRTLNLEGNELSGSIPPEMHGLLNVDTLMLVPNDLSGCVPAELPEIWVGQSQLPRCKSRATVSP